MRKNETSLVYSCIDYLTKLGNSAWRNNTGTMVNSSGKKVRFGQPGAPDIMGIIVSQNGRCLCVECKMPGNVLTLNQSGWLQNAERAGAAIAVVRSMEDLFEFVDNGYSQSREYLQSEFNKAKG